VITRLFTLCFPFLPLFLHFSPLFSVYFSILSLYLSLGVPGVLIFTAIALWQLSCILTEQSLCDKTVWPFVAVLKFTPLVTILIEVCHLPYIPLGLYWNYVQRGSITCMLKGSVAIFFRGCLPLDWSCCFAYARLWSFRSIPCIPSWLMTAHEESSVALVLFSDITFWKM